MPPVPPANNLELVKVLHQLIGDPADVRPRVVEHLKGRDLREQEPAEDSGYRRCIPYGGRTLKRERPAGLREGQGRETHKH